MKSGLHPWRKPDTPRPGLAPTDRPFKCALVPPIGKLDEEDSFDTSIVNGNTTLF